MSGLERVRAWSVAGSLSAVVGVILPLQTFLGNSEIFPFATGRILPELLGIFVLFTLGLRLIGWLGDQMTSVLSRQLRPAMERGPYRVLQPPRIFSTFFSSFLTAALVCVYLESGVLSLGLPELNGGPVAELSDRTRMAVDAGVWCAVVAAFLVFARKVRPWLHWIALAVLALSIASLADVWARRDVKRETREATAGTGGGRKASVGRLAYESQPTVVANVRYSPARNILIFVLDSMPGKASVDALAADRALAAKFPGFTAYPENIGMHECTKRGVPGLVTGRHYDPAEMSEADYPMTMYGTNSFVRAADAAGWNVAFSPDLLPYGATNLPVGERVARAEARRARDRFAFLRQSTEVPFLSLFDTVAFRLSPFPFKGPILYSRIRHAVKGRHSDSGFWGEASLYPALASRPVSAETRPFLGFFHSWGVHPPWKDGFARAVTEKFAALGRLMDAYRATGLYDRSLIVVTSDHGLDAVPPPAGYPPSASALLLVKPESARAPFGVSAARTSHARIAPLVASALAAPPDASACERILREDRPLYRAEVREGARESFRDWP